MCECYFNALAIRVTLVFFHYQQNNVLVDFEFKRQKKKKKKKKRYQPHAFKLMRQKLF